MEPKGLGLSVFKERYAHEHEEWQDACRRVATSAGAHESIGVRESYYQALVNGRLMPGGRIWYGAGRVKQQMLNCFVVPTGDSREDWGRTMSDFTVVTGTGGGVGFNFSPIRPRGAAISGVGGEATGSVSLMSMLDGIAKGMVGGGNRRAAMMMCLAIDHPDILEFIDTKLNKEALNNANVSLVIPPTLEPETIVHLYKTGGKIALRHDGKTYGELPVREFLASVVKNALSSGEPGILNQYLAEKENNVGYAHPLTSTNPCGEIWLPDYGCCDLGALVLPSFVVGGELDWDALADTIAVGVRFLDNVLDVNYYPLHEIEKMCQAERRIGLGVMGLHSMLLDLGMMYDSEQGLAFIDKLFHFIKITAYKASIELAKEKGPFPLYDARYLASPFVRRLPREIRNAIAEYGIRNCALLTVAPTGTTSMVHGVTSGIEPLFAPAYFRRRKVAADIAGEFDTIKTLVIHADYLNHPDIAQGAYDIPVWNHLEVQKIVQSHIDNAVSKTINVSKGVKFSELMDATLAYLPYLKGFTVYQEGSRDDEPLEAIHLDKVAEVLQSWDGETDYDGMESLDCVTGVCTI